MTEENWKGRRCGVTPRCHRCPPAPRSLGRAASRRAAGRRPSALPGRPPLAAGSQSTDTGGSRNFCRSGSSVMHRGNYPPRDGDFGGRIRWKWVLKVFRVCEQSAPWPDPKGPRRRPEARRDFKGDLCRGLDGDTGQLVTSAHRACPPLMSGVCPAGSHTDRTTQKTASATGRNASRKN